MPKAITKLGMYTSTIANTMISNSVINKKYVKYGIFFSWMSFSMELLMNMMLAPVQANVTKVKMVEERTPPNTQVGIDGKETALVTEGSKALAHW